MSNDTDTTPVAKVAPAKAASKRMAGLAKAEPVKRVGRPAAPQTEAEMVDAFIKQIQAGRKAIDNAAKLAARIASAQEGTNTVNWRHLDAIRSELGAIDYELHAAQVVIGRTGFSEPTDKL